MSSPRIPFVVLAIAGALLALPARSSAQPPDRLACPRQPFESDSEWSNRCYAEEQQRDTGRRVREAQRVTAATPRQRGALEKQPPLMFLDGKLQFAPERGATRSASRRRSCRTGSRM